MSGTATFQVNFNWLKWMIIHYQNFFKTKNAFLFQYSLLSWISNKELGGKSEKRTENQTHIILDSNLTTVPAE